MKINTASVFLWCEKLINTAWYSIRFCKMWDYSTGYSNIIYIMLFFIVIPSNIAINRVFAVALYVLFRFPLYKGGWFQQMSDRVYRQASQCPFAKNRMSAQTSVWNCEGIPYLLIHRHFRINLLAFSILHSGQEVCRFSWWTPSRFLCFGI